MKPNGWVKQSWIPRFTLQRLIVVTTTLAIGLAVCPYLPMPEVDAYILMVTLIGFCIGVLYHGAPGGLGGAIAVWFFVGVALLIVIAAARLVNGLLGGDFLS